MKTVSISIIYLLFSIFSTRLLANNESISHLKSFLTKSDTLGYLQSPDGSYLEVKIAKEYAQKSKGFSGVKSNQVHGHQGIFFFYESSGPRSFWMPDTYFDLAIIFLDKNLKILSLIKNAPHHPGHQEPPKIYKTPSVNATHVLELKASSPVVKTLEIGQKFVWLKEPRSQKK